ncbi:MAG: hypothetical protein GYA51_07140 [Candidatus Methanofastidiosa archaeon]|nr:hypothetical protein [Candidatus Methanofastidiosa archaeon]
MLIASIVASLVGIIIFLFLFWQRTKEDYSSEIIFGTAFNVLLFLLLLCSVSIRFYPSAFYWACIVGAIIGLVLSIFKYKVRFYEILEALIVSSLPWLSFIFLADSVTRSSLKSFIGFIVILLFVFISYYLNANYKNFSWYRSGRIGFAGISTAMIFFVVRSILAILGISVLSFVSIVTVEAIISGIAALVCLVLIVNLSRTKI